jgi:hypothetical protein
VSQVSVLVMIDPARRDHLGDLAAAIAGLGVTVRERIPELGLLVVDIDPGRLEQLRRLEGVIAVERSRTLQPLG